MTLQPSKEPPPEGGGNSLTPLSVLFAKFNEVSRNVKQYENLAQKLKQEAEQHTQQANELKLQEQQHRQQATNCEKKANTIVAAVASLRAGDLASMDASGLAILAEIDHETATMVTAGDPIVEADTSRNSLRMVTRDDPISEMDDTNRATNRKGSADRPNIDLNTGRFTLAHEKIPAATTPPPLGAGMLHPVNKEEAALDNQSTFARPNEDLPAATAPPIVRAGALQTSRRAASLGPRSTDPTPSEAIPTSTATPTIQAGMAQPIYGAPGLTRQPSKNHVLDRSPAKRLAQDNHTLVDAQSARKLARIEEPMISHGEISQIGQDAIENQLTLHHGDNEYASIGLVPDGGAASDDYVLIPKANDSFQSSPVLSRICKISWKDVIQDSPLVARQDVGIAPDGVTAAMAQCLPCVLTEDNRVGRYKHQERGYIGIMCKHCFGQPGYGR